VRESPPPISQAEFIAVDISDENEIGRRFHGYVRDLHAYLNQLSCLRDLQQARHKWKSRTSEKEAFGNLGLYPKHWYTFHHGGRNEAQLNLGLWPDYFRVGLGFEFTLKKGGDPSVVWLAYSCFVNVIRQQLSLFQTFVSNNSLEIEWEDRDGNLCLTVGTEHVVGWLLDPPSEPRWIFIDRLFKRDHDEEVLAHPEALATVIQSVLCGFRPIWEQTQLLAAKSA
jgi:hypothetical protein